MSKSPSDLKRLVERHGGNLAMDWDDGYERCYQAEAPEGKMWVASDCRDLVVRWFPSIPSAKDDAYMDLQGRVSMGLRDMTTEELEMFGPES